MEGLFFFSSNRRHTRWALVTGVQTCGLPICRRRVQPGRLLGTCPPRLWRRRPVLHGVGRLLFRQLPRPAELGGPCPPRLYAQGGMSRLPPLKQAASPPIRFESVIEIGRAHV